MNVAELWKAWAENVEGDFTLQIKAVLAIATAFFLLGQLLHKTVRVFPNDKDNAQAISRLVGYIHHCMQVPLALYILQTPSFWEHKLRAHSPESFTLIIFSAGYFLHDFLHSAIHVKDEGIEYVFHGGASMFVYWGALFFTPPAFHFYGAGFILWEVSSCFLHFGWFLHKMGKYTFLQFLNGAAVLLTFFVFRLLWGPYLTYSFYQETQVPPFKGNAIVIACYFASTALNTLNFYWFYLLCRKAVRMAKGADKDKDR
mmetsp:Transcript_29843/g.77328  ORF Transcript_29843/g.77328 Transcript_29843/m.77328 type:complete len:257 (+) Transcript_29843:1234-2004(+)